MFSVPSYLYLFVAVFLITLATVGVEAQRGGRAERNKLVYVEKDATRIDREIPHDFLYRGVSIHLCSCSPTKRGHPPLDKPEVVKFLAALERVQDTPFADLLRASIERLAEYAARDLAEAYSTEGMVNLDATLRNKGKIVFCVYLKDTSKITNGAVKAAAGKNIGKNLNLWRTPPTEAHQFVTLKPCDQVPITKASDEIVGKFVKPNAAAGNTANNNEKTEL